MTREQQFEKGAQALEANKHLAEVYVSGDGRVYEAEHAVQTRQHVLGANAAPYVKVTRDVATTRAARKAAPVADAQAPEGSEASKAPASDDTQEIEEKAPKKTAPEKGAPKK